MLEDAKKQSESLKVELDQVRQELVSVQKELSKQQGGKPAASSDTAKALDKANKRISELEQQLKAQPGPSGDPAANAVCDQQLEKMEIKQLQCQMRLAKRSKNDKDSVFAENERLRDIMQEAVNLLGLKPSGEVPALVYGTPAPPAPPPATTPTAAGEETLEAEEQGLPFWAYLVFFLSLITGGIAGYAFFDFRSRQGVSARL
jgi:hypothetical protein